MSGAGAQERETGVLLRLLDRVRAFRRPEAVLGDSGLRKCLGGSLLEKSEAGVSARVVVLGEAGSDASGAAEAEAQELRFVRAVGDGFFLLEDGRLAELVQ